MKQIKHHCPTCDVYILEGHFLEHIKSEVHQSNIGRNQIYIGDLNSHGEVIRL
jgi:hypothetical protein